MRKTLSNVHLGDWIALLDATPQGHFDPIMKIIKEALSRSGQTWANVGAALHKQLAQSEPIDVPRKRQRDTIARMDEEAGDGA